MKNITAYEAVKQMKVGWNIGNSLDAFNNKAQNSETSWNNPPITENLIESVCGSGFDVIRIPVTWFDHFTDESGTIDSAWLERVKTIVDYAYSRGRTVILNTHHENWIYTSLEAYEKEAEVLKCVWRQIAEYFGSYDERLLFEGVNEPRLFGKPEEWQDGTAEARSVVNMFNRDFVDVIRSSGGNNAVRNLLIATYCGSCSEAVMSELEIPSDEHIIVTIHSYQPWIFCCGNNEHSTDVFDENDERFLEPLEYTFRLMKKYCIDRGIPIIIGEFGALDKENLEERLKYLKYFLKRTAEMGIKNIWWDNGYTKKNAFGLFDRYTGKPHCPEIIELLTK